MKQCKAAFFCVVFFVINTLSGMFEAVKNGDAAYIKKLLLKGSHVDQLDSDGWTPLMVAALGGHHESVELLLTYGANHHHKGRHGLTALRYACAKGHAKVIRLLALFYEKESLYQVKTGQYNICALLQKDMKDFIEWSAQRKPEKNLFGWVTGWFTTAPEKKLSRKKMLSALHPLLLLCLILSKNLR